MMRLPFGKRNVQRDIDEELRFHFDARIEELMSLGRTHAEARAQATAEFGDVNDVRSSLREIDNRVARRRHRGEVFSTLLSDTVYSLRSLRRTPIVSITIILTLALGIGLNATMISFLDVIFLRPPTGVAEPGELRRLWGKHGHHREPYFWPSFGYAAFDAVRESAGSRAEMALYGTPVRARLGRGENLPTANVSRASASYFRILRVKPALGRLYGPDEDQLTGAAPVVVISDAFWRRELEGDSAVIGRVIVFDKTPLTVIGIMPPGFTGVDLNATDAWYPLATDAGAMNPTPWYRDPNVNAFQVLVRVAPNASEAPLEQGWTAALNRPGISYPWDTLVTAKLGSIVAARGPGKIDTETQVATRLAGVAVIVLVIACANVVNLLLARAVKRRREIAVRLALGISQSRLVRLLVTESVLLAMAATVGALFAASWGGTLIRTFLMPRITWAGTPVDWRVSLFALGIATLVGVAAGLVPALQARAPDLTKALKAGSREFGAHRSHLRGLLVVCQAALSVLLLAGAALFVQSLLNARQVDIGYTVDRLAFVSLEIDPRDGAANAARSARLLELEPRLASIPGVERVAFASLRPKWGMQFVSYFPDADTVRNKKPEGIFTAVSSEFFATTGTKLVRGRTFARGSAARNERSVIVNEAMANALWPKEDPLGKCVRFDNANAQCATVIGVTQTAMLDALREQPSPHFYLPLENMPIRNWGIRAVLFRADQEHMTLALNSVLAMVKAEASGVPLTPNTMARIMEPEYRPWRLGATLFSLFGGLAALVAAIGIFSTVSYAVSQRTHEFGVRAALGADVAAILRQVLGEGMRTVVVGVVVGIALAIAAGRFVASLLYGVEPGNAIAMLLAGSALLAIAAAASFIPAWRAAKADPVSALRSE